MKTKQIVVIIFTLLFVLCGVFPPWRSPGGFNSGYRMLFNPPSQSHVDLSRLLVEWVLVAVVGVVAWWLVGGNKKPLGFKPGASNQIPTHMRVEQR